MSNVPLNFQKGYQQCSDLKGCVDKGSWAQTVMQSSDHYFSSNVMTLRSTFEYVFECMKMCSSYCASSIYYIQYITCFQHVCIGWNITDIYWIPPLSPSPSITLFFFNLSSYILRTQHLFVSCPCRWRREGLAKSYACPRNFIHDSYLML